MFGTLYKKNDLTLPHLIESKRLVWMEEGRQKTKLEEQWVVLTENVNDFIENLARSKDGKTLNQPSIEKRGPLSIINVTYGERGYSTNGEIDWWSCSNGVLSFHIKRWVDNTPTAIKAFCQSCMKSYGYEPDEVTVNCNPEVGEAKVLCEATFTPDIETNEENDPTTGENWGDDSGEGDGEEDESGTQTESINCSSSIDTLTPTAEICLTRKLPTSNATDIINIINGVESGELVYKRAGDYGGRIATSGWYRADDTNPNNINQPEYVDGGNITKQQVDRARVILKSIPDVMVPSIRVTVTQKVTSKNKLTLGAISAGMTSAGTETKVIKSGNVTIPVPTGIQAKDVEGTIYPIANINWLNEGTSFDGTSIRKKSSLTTGKTYYEGTMSTSYRTVVTLSAGGEAGD